MNTAFFLESAANKIRRKKGQAVFTCQARSTLEAAVAEIINEIPSCDLSKWTGNKSLLIGPAGGARAVATASWKLQVLAKYCGYQPGGQVRGSRRPEEASGSGGTCLCLAMGALILWIQCEYILCIVFFVRFGGGGVAEKLPNI